MINVLQKQYLEYKQKNYKSHIDSDTQAQMKRKTYLTQHNIIQNQ